MKRVVVLRYGENKRYLVTLITARPNQDPRTNEKIFKRRITARAYAKLVSVFTKAKLYKAI